MQAPRPAGQPWLALVGVAGALAAVAGVVHVAARERGDPARCPVGLLALGARCCAEGQTIASGRCTGEPRRCPSPMMPARGGCLAPPRRVAFAGGIFAVGAAGWEREAGERRVTVAPFDLDSIEVTTARWGACVSAGVCRALAWGEPGQPVRGVSVEEAGRFCTFEGGRLPTGNEWLVAAAGREGRRFPWGQTGLVCRRAAFGLADGPCGSGADGPDLAGARPDGASPEGVLDLAGGVAEWTLEPGGGALARGGSFRSQAAAELLSTAAESPPPHADTVGLRCARDRP